MNFAPMKPLLELAEEKGIAYGAFVTVSYDSALAAIEAGSELNTPVIFITGTDCCDLMGGFAGTVETSSVLLPTPPFPSLCIWITAAPMRNVCRPSTPAIPPS